MNVEGNVEGAALEFIQLQLLDKGGIVMVLIGLLSIIAAVIVIERLLYFRGRRSDEEKLLKRLANTLQRGHFDEALGVCEQFHNSLATLIQVGIRHVRDRRLSVRELRDHLVEAASLEIPKDERFLSALGTIAHIAPLLGLLGTVTGNIRAFGVLGELGGITDPALLSRGISEALLTTAAGIIVSIPAIIFYNSLVSKVNHRIIRLENRASELATMLIDADQAPRPGRQVIHNGNGAVAAVDGNGTVNGNGAVDANDAATGIGAMIAAAVPSQAEVAPRLVSPEVPHMDSAPAGAGARGTGAGARGTGAGARGGDAYPRRNHADVSRGWSNARPSGARTAYGAGAEPLRRGTGAPGGHPGGHARGGGAGPRRSGTRPCGGEAGARGAGVEPPRGRAAWHGRGAEPDGSGAGPRSGGTDPRRSRADTGDAGPDTCRGSAGDMKERRGLKPQHGVNLVPMIDVVFQLVIFFMVSTTFKVVPGIELNLPESNTAEVVNLTPLVVSVGGPDEIYVNDQEVTIGGLEGALRAVAGGETLQPGDHPVVVEGDASVPYDLMVDVLDVLRVLGFHSASLRTRDPRAPGSGR